MSIESFHRSLHGAGNDEPMLAKLRAITRIEDPAQIREGGGESDLAGWADWGGNVSVAAPGLS
ncbi:MAG TPA: hypothetical protein VN851_01455 [Thermoanaerobaculia bacterium]|nr:hypothetical protein [Thermoanaerobaculia bacterium]